MHTKQTEKLIAKQPINEESQPKLFLVTDVSGSSEQADQVPFCEELGTAKKVTPRKPTNKSVREREYLTKKEVYSLIDAAKGLGRYGKRDGLMIFMAYLHGFRVGELIDLKWTQVDLTEGRLHVNRLKKGDSSVHLLKGDEMRQLRALQRSSDSPFVFSSERGASLTARAFQLIVARAGVKAGMTFPVHPHMLRHSTGFALANAGEDTRAIQAFLGHRNIAHTVTYTALQSDRFNTFNQVL